MRVALFLCRFVLFPPLATVLSSPLGAAADVARVRTDGNRWLRHLRLRGLTFDRLKSRNTCKLLFPWNKLAGGLPRLPADYGGSTRLTVESDGALLLAEAVGGSAGVGSLVRGLELLDGERDRLLVLVAAPQRDHLEIGAGHDHLGGVEGVAAAAVVQRAQDPGTRGRPSDPVTDGIWIGLDCARECHGFPDGTPY